MGVGLKPHLPDGTYTGTYRVISADTHIVYGGLVFNIGHAGRGAEVHRRRADRQEQERQGHRGRVRRRARPGLPHARADGRRACLPVLRVEPALQRVAGGEQRWSLASRAFAAAPRATVRRRDRARRARAACSACCCRARARPACRCGASLKGSIINDTLDSRFGDGLGPARHRLDRARRRAAGGTGDASRRDPGAAGRPDAAGQARRLGARSAARRCSRCSRSAAPTWRCTPALAGHASIESPRRRVLPLRRAARARGERLGWRDRLPAARAAGGHAPARGPRAQPAADRGARALLADRARRAWS